MNSLTPILALTGVIVGAALSYFFTFMAEQRREQWALGREWRERKLQAYGQYVSCVKRMRDIAERIAASVQLDDHAPPLQREAGLEPLAEANMARSSSFETVNLIGGSNVVAAGQELNRAIWRIEWFARGLLDDTDRDGWAKAFDDYFTAINGFHRAARADLGVSGEFSPRAAQPSPRLGYENARRPEIEDPPTIPVTADPPG
ncbi:hypothetical protein [Winogradskya humida]|uniref:LemA protein n=1 Tax=Winogradskya humida TaxID=113566 RepID=A0ABQ3ZJ36_9ACTN|nr:hypothetical protein [Actinoplanes humidus]GIE18232.1 hypothetical protein Ahu01nite_013340 [Actinoplanes humidus]